MPANIVSNESTEKRVWGCMKYAIKGIVKYAPGPYKPTQNWKWICIDHKSSQGEPSLLSIAVARRLPKTHGYYVTSAFGESIILERGEFKTRSSATL